MIVLPMLVYALLGGVVLTTRALGINCRGQNCDDKQHRDAQELAGDISNAQDKVWKDGECIGASFFFYVELS